MAAIDTLSPKYQQVYTALRREIQSGRLKKGDRLPSEAELVRTFGASRITVGRAVRDLQAAGLVERRAGSGTYVKSPQTARALSFGLLIPDLGETEIFEPICQGMMASPIAREHALIWGSPAGASKEERAWQLCRQYIDRGVSGVFFAPLEGSGDSHDINQRIARSLDEARIPVILLDRTVVHTLGRNRITTASLQQREDLATIIHLCGSGAGNAYARRGFRLRRGQRCGDHDPRRYLAEVHALKLQFARLAASG